MQIYVFPVLSTILPFPAVDRCRSRLWNTVFQLIELLVELALSTTVHYLTLKLSIARREEEEDYHDNSASTTGEYVWSVRL